MFRHRLHKNTANLFLFDAVLVRDHIHSQNSIYIVGSYTNYVTK